MKKVVLYLVTPLLAAACGHDGDFDASGTFEATEVTVSAEAAGRILWFGADEGDRLVAGEQVGAIDSVQTYLQKAQLERQQASVRAPHVPMSPSRRQPLRERIARQRIEYRRVENLPA